MSDFSTDLAEPQAPDTSTQLDAPRPSDETITRKPETDDTAPPEEKRKPETRLETIKRTAREIEAANRPKDEPAKGDADKPEAAKTETAKEAAPAKPNEAPADDKQPQKGDEPRQRSQIEPPEKFLPRAKELWRNVPHEVRSEVMRTISEAQTETTQARESAKEYEALRPYADMAKQSGTTLNAAVASYVRMENALRTDPASGFRELLTNMDISPVQAIGHVLAAFNVRPEQLAQHIASNPNEYTALRQPQARQQAEQQPNREVEALRSQMEQMQADMQRQQVERDVIAPFAASHPRYEELSSTIASFLNSDMVPRTLEPMERLAAAYDMAVRVSPRHDAPSETPAESASAGRAGSDFGGDKSVRGAPASGVETTNIRRGKLSRGDAIKAAMADIGISA